MSEATRVDVANRRVLLADAEISYDFLIVATGATHAYFGHPDWAAIAPGLKTLEDAIEMRRLFLTAFEEAENIRIVCVVGLVVYPHLLPNRISESDICCVELGMDVPAFPKQRKTHYLL